MTAVILTALIIGIFRYQAQYTLYTCINFTLKEQHFCSINDGSHRIKKKP